jgi:8-oxo-dGTP pyrophosphatase MutT (NUDIX family)
VHMAGQGRVNAGNRSLRELLGGYEPGDETEKGDVERLLALVTGTADPWTRQSALHVTASALIVHPGSGRVLLRWHQRQQAWLQVGGHGDPGEHDALAIAIREGEEETGLPDLAPWPDARLRHVVIVRVPEGRGEPAHEHGDLRFFLATGTPEAIMPENPDAPLRWLTPAEAHEVTAEPNLRETLARATQAGLLGSSPKDSRAGSVDGAWRGAPVPPASVHGEEP